MPGTLKLLKTLCRQAPVMAFMALATSGLATDARASGWAPEATADVTFNSDSGRESSKTVIPVLADKNDDITITFESTAGHDSNAYCNHRAWVVDWKVDFKDGGSYNTPIELYSKDLARTRKAGKYFVPITLCKRGIGNSFKIVWTRDKGTTFDSSVDHCSTTSCHTTVTIHKEDPPVATLVLTSATIDESGNANTSAITATLNKTAGDIVTLDVSASPVSPAVDGDFNLSQNTTLTIPAGSKTSAGTVTITAEDNSMDAPEKTITVSATASGADVKDPESKTLTIVDDDDAPTGITLTVDTDSIAEGAPATNITVTASVDGTTRYGDAKTVQVTVGGTDSTATSGTDYAQVGGFPITIQAGEASATGTFSLNPTDDSDHEGDETIIVAGTFSGITIAHATLTITDNDDPPPDTPVVQFASVSSNAAEDVGTRNVTVNLSPAAPSGGLTLGYSVTGTATAGSGNDFTIQNSGTLSVSAGAATATIPITINDDSANENDETVILTLTGGTGYALGSTSVHTLTITDNDSTATQATLSLSGPADTNEGNSGTSDKYFTVSLSGTPSRFVSWRLCFTGTATIDVTAAGTIPASADYQPISGQTPIDLSGRNPVCTDRSFSPPFSSLSNTDVGIRIKGDIDSESDETVIVTLSIDDGPADVVLGTSVATYTILDDDGTLTDSTAPRVSSIIRQSPSTSPTSADSLTWRATFNEAVQNVDAADFQVSGTTATHSVSEVSGTVYDVTASGGDLAGLTATVTLAFASGQDIEDANTNRLTNTAPTDTNHNTFEVENTAAAPSLVLSTNTLSVAEGGSGNYTVSLATEPTGMVTVSIASNNSDVTVSPASLTFHASIGSKPWNTAQTVTVSAGQDGDDADESATLTHTAAGGGYGSETGSVTVTVSDNDKTASPLSSPSQPAITISGGSPVTEGAPASFTVHAGPAPSGNLEVSLDVSEETGGGQDYVASGNEGGKSVTINAGSSTATFTVGTIADSTDEPNGRVMVAVGTGSSYSVGSTSSASVTVNDDDATPSSSLSSPSQPVITIAGSSAVTEGTAASFTLTASPAPSADLDVSVDVTQSGNFVASSDRGTKTVTIPSGQTSKTFTIPTQSDSTDEPDGSVTSTLAGGSGYSVGSTSSASVTVNDDDDPPPPQPAASFGDDRSLSIDDATAMEKDGVISFTVRLSAATVGNSQATVRVATRDVTAVSGLDYRSVDTRLVFRAGETAKVVTVGLINDAHNEGTETFEVVLSNPSNAIIGDGVATGTINNADYVPRSELAHFGRQVANQVLEGVIGRIRSPRAPGVSARIAGNAVPSGRAPGPNCTVCNTLSTDKRVEKFDREEVLTNSSFVLNGQDAPGRSPAFWGRGTRSDFTDRPGGLSLDGGVTSFMLGADLGWNDGRLLGLALIRSSGEIDHMEWAGGGDRNTGRTELTLTALVPYAGWKINERVDAWGALGHGSGEMHLGLNAGERAEEISAGFDWTMAAGGLRGALAGFDDGPRLTAVLDGWRVKTSSKETEGLAATRSSMTRLRAGLEAGWEMQLEDGAVLAPRLETNLIRESGDTGSSFGLELVGGLSWTDPGLGLAIDMSARRLRSDESSGRKDHGYSMALVYDPDPDSGRGLSLSMRQETGNPGSTMDDFLTSSLPGGADEGGTHWTTELAYGLPAVGGSFTGSPHAGIEETDDYRDYKLGWRLTPAGPQAPDISFDINASRREQTMSSSADHRLGIGLVAEW